LQFGERLRPARRSELVVDQPIHHSGDASPDAADQLQSGRSDQAGAHHEYRRYLLQSGELAGGCDLACDRYRMHCCPADGYSPNLAVGCRVAWYPLLPDDSRLPAGPTVLFPVVDLSDHGDDASWRL